MTDITIVEALWITAVSMGVVFTTLVVISLILDVQRLIFYKKPSPVKVEKVHQGNLVSEEKVMTEEEKVIALAAAAHFSSKPNAQIRIRSIKRLV